MSNLVSKATFSKATEAKRNSSVSFCLRSAAVPSERGGGKCTSEDDGERRWRWMSGSSSSSHGAVELWRLDTMRASKEKTVVGGAWGGGGAAAAPRPQENRCVLRGIITLIIVIVVSAAVCDCATRRRRRSRSVGCHSRPLSFSDVFLDCGMQGYVWIRSATSAFEAIS